MTGTEIYKRTAAYELAATGIRLHAPHWKLLLAFDGQRSLAEVALSQDVAFAEALPLTEKFLREGWIEEQPITLDQYLKRTGAGNSPSLIGAAIASPVVLHEGHAPAIAARRPPPQRRRSPSLRRPPCPSARSMRPPLRPQIRFRPAFP